MPVKGGSKLAAHLRQQQQAPQVQKVSIGVHGGRYPDGQQIAQVALSHEYGAGPPMRPFMRPAIYEVADKVRRLLRDRIDPKTLTANRIVAQELGQLVQDAIRSRIILISEPPIRDSTRRGRSSQGTPLVDTRRLLGHIEYEVS